MATLTPLTTEKEPEMTNTRKLMLRRLEVVTFMLENYPINNSEVRDWLIDEQNNLTDALEQQEAAIAP